MQELRQDAARAFLGRVDVVQVRADPVEGAEERELQALPMAIGPDDAVQELFRAGVDPPLLVDGAVNERRGLLVELRVRAHPVHLGGRGEDHALAVADGLLDDAQVLLEVEVEDRQRILHIRRRRRDRDEREHDVALLDLVLDPLLVDRDVPFEVGEPRVRQKGGDLVARDVQARDRPVGCRENALGQRVSDEAVDAEDQDLHRARIPERKAAASISSSPSLWMRRISTYRSSSQAT